MAENIKLAPTLEAKWLRIGGWVALGAAELACITYAAQSASNAQALDLGGGIILQTDVVMKAAMQVAAGLSLLLGPAVAVYLWRGSGKSRWKRLQAWVAIAASVVGLGIAASNLSGYNAWTRGQASAEAAASGELYAVAQANAARAAEGRALLSSADRRRLEAAERPLEAKRDVGDWLRALGTLLLISAMGSGFVIQPPKPATSRRNKRAPKRNDTSELDRARANRT